jgi:predicted KAP-like P-loop ATPase
MVDNTPKHSFSADRPISSRNEDLLGRSAFAESLASAIKGWMGNDSLVIALYGPWGSGKSSVKNILLESLREATKDCLLIIEFNDLTDQQRRAIRAFQQALKRRHAGKSDDAWSAYEEEN